MQIRRALAGDSNSIAIVLQKAFAEYKSIYTLRAFTSTTAAIELVESRLREGPVWVALQNSSIVGTASAVASDKGMYIRGMAVIPEARGQNIGENLLRRIEEYALNLGITRLFLSVTPQLIPAIRFYEHFGFHRTGENQDNLTGEKFYTMEKVLDKTR